MSEVAAESALTAAFAPSGVCVVGASDRQWSYGRRTIENLIRHGFSGPVVPINPRYSEIEGLRCLPSVADLPPSTCDLAIVLTRAERLPELLDELSGSGVRVALVFSSPPPGRSMRTEVQNAVRETGIRVIGFGASLVSAGSSLAAGAFSAAWAGGLTYGPVALVSQSGGVFGSALNYFLDAGIGIRWLVSIGSAVDVSVPEVLSWMRSHSGLAAIGLFLEGERYGDRLVDELQALKENRIHVVAIKVGVSESAQQVAATHTGTATGDDRVWEEVFRQTGVVRVDEVPDMCSLLDGFARTRTRALSAAARGGGFVAASVGSAGGAALAADSLARAGVRMLDYSDDEKLEVAKRLPSGDPVNPVDIAGVKGLPNEEVGALRDLLELWSTNPRVAGVLVIAPAMGYEAPAARVVGETWHGLDKPLAVAWVAGSMADPGRLMLRRLGVPSFDRIDLAARFLRALQDIADDGQPDAPATVPPHVDRLTTGEAAVEELARAGISFPKRLVLPVEDVQRLTQPLVGLREPWVVKLDAPGVAHKADLGAVLIRETPGEPLVQRVLLATDRMRKQGISPPGLVVEELIENGTELFAAVLDDETFGLVSLLGLGGVRVDRLTKPALWLGVPNTDEISDLLERSGAIDDLARASIDPSASAAALHDVFISLSRVAADPVVMAIELNPIVLTGLPPTAIALDATIVLGPLVPTPTESEVNQ